MPLLVPPFLSEFYPELYLSGNPHLLENSYLYVPHFSFFHLSSTFYGLSVENGPVYRGSPGHGPMLGFYVPNEGGVSV